MTTLPDRALLIMTDIPDTYATHCLRRSQVCFALHPYTVSTALERVLIVNQHGWNHHKEGVPQHTERRILEAYTISQALTIANNDKQYRLIAKNANGIVSVSADTILNYL